MEFREAPFGHFLVLERSEELLESVTRLATETGIRAATLTGLGALSSVTLGFYDLSAQSYVRASWTEEMEVCSLVGNLAEVDGGPFPHIHGVFGRRDFSCLGGHVFEAVVSVTLELALHTAPEPLRRLPVDFCDLKLLSLR